MTHIRMIFKHVCLSGMPGIIQSKITLRIYILLPLLCSTVCPKFLPILMLSRSFFPILANGFFPKLLEKALVSNQLVFQFRFPDEASSIT